MQFLHHLNFIQGFLLGLTIGFLVGIFAMVLIGKNNAKSEDMLAWTIAIVWLCWHVAAGFSGGSITVPPTMFDIVSGGSVGFIFGEKFFDYVVGAVIKNTPKGK